MSGRGTTGARDHRDAGMSGHGSVWPPGCQDAPMSPQGEEAKPQTEIIHINAL
jgi:hypothetical protein